MLTLLLGTDWVANRNKILEMISADVRNGKGNRVLLVPELISHDMERRLCVSAGDTCSRYAEVLSFSRLVRRVSEYDHIVPKACLDNGGRIVAMANATKQLHSKLKAYASVETKPEFLSGLVDIVDEFKRCCIKPEDLFAASRETEGSLAQKLEELGLILESYNSVCANGKIDPRDQIDWLLDALEDSNYAAEHCFYIDGFPDFTHQHRNVIAHLIRNSPSVAISLNCDKAGSEAMSFYKAGETAAELLRIAKAAGVEVKICEVEARNNPAYLVRKYLLEGRIAETSDAVQVYRAKSVFQECSVALEKVLELVRSGARYRDINIACANMGTYRNTLELLFEKCGVPLYVSGTEDILDEPAIKTVFSALEAAIGGFELQDMVQYLKAMLSPLDVDTSDMVENYSLLWGISGKRWEETWTNHPDELGGRWTDEAKEKIAKLNSARITLVEPLIELRESVNQAKNLSDMIRGLYNYLEAVRYSERLSQHADSLDTAGLGREAQIINQLWDILVMALEQLYDTLGQTVWDPESFLRLFKLLISQYDVGTIPPVLDAVSVGSMDVMRCQECKYLIVLGAEEGALPGYCGSAGVLSDQERTYLRQLGVPLTGGSMDGLMAEFADIYGVFSGASDLVFVSYSGNEPSFVYKRLSAIAGGELEQPEILLGAAMGNVYEASSFLLRHNADRYAKELQIQDALVQLDKNRAHMLGEITPEYISKLYGSELRLSASRIDLLAQCRMAYFLRFGLAADERKPAEVNPAEFGTYVHAVLEDTVRTVMLNGGIKNVTAEEMLDIAKKASDAYMAERFAVLETDRIAYLFRRNWEELAMIVYDLWDEFQNSDFSPVGLEVAFGDGCEIPAIDVSGKSIRAKLRGYVDRVDLWENEGKNYFRVVDYKTGRKDFDYCDIYNGYGLQMLLYLFALQDSNAELIGSEPVAAGVQYFPARAPLVSADGQLAQEEALKARKKKWKRKGLILNDAQALGAMEYGDSPKRMPYSRKKDGTISGDLADHKQFAILKKYLFIKVGELVDEIASGNISPNPYTRGTSHNACTYCPYGSVCHKNTVTGRRNYQSTDSKQFWEDVEKVVNKNGG